LANSIDNSSQLKAQFKEHQAQLSSMKQKADIFEQENTINAEHWCNHSFSVQDEDVEVAFLHEKQKWSQS